MREKKERNLAMVKLYLSPDDLSLSEIGRVYGISKQAVHVIVKRYNQTTYNGNLRGLWGRVIRFIEGVLK